MARRFEAFVIFAEMRTGSNHLEESLNGLADIECHGEVFNPTFIGHHNRFEFLGYDLARRERDPVGLVDAMIARGDTLPGFRFFHDHDPRVLDRVLDDPRIAKVLLTRNPLDSYVSRRIATETGQWRLTDLKHSRSGKIDFDAAGFARMLDDWSAFRDRLRRGLQVTGQTTFHIRYEDINDADILNGLAAFLGSSHRLSAASDRLKRQNPGGIEDKVANVPEMTAALARIDRFGLDRVTDGEVPRAPGVSGFVAHPEAGLLFLPVAGIGDRPGARLDGRDRRCRSRGPCHRHDPEGPAKVDAVASRASPVSRCCAIR
jgi:LPS sulfotransferase NodH